jgi:hypothetical protein
MFKNSRCLVAGTYARALIKLSDETDFEGVLWDTSLVRREQVVGKPLLETGKSLRAYTLSW